MLRHTNKVGLVSMMEAIVTATIFTIAFIGIYMSMSNIHPAGSDSMDKLKAAYVAKGVLDSLHQEVRADTWDSGSLAVGNYSLTVNGYSVAYNVADVAGLNLRQVNIIIDY